MIIYIENNHIKKKKLLKTTKIYLHNKESFFHKYKGNKYFNKEIFKSQFPHLIRL